MKYKLSLGIVFILLVIGIVSAEPFCFPPPDEGLLCLDGILTSEGGFCSLENIVGCDDRGCENGACVGTTFTCTNGEERCCRDKEDCETSQFQDRLGNSFECQDNQWSLKESCGTDDCIEESFTEAVCQRKRYYCPGVTNCFWTNQKDPGCFDTLSDKTF